MAAFICMPDMLLYPLDRIRPDQLLSQYSDWVYFTLVLVFFISIAGITLRKHFDRPYVKPLIISVGILLTVGVFGYKNHLVQIIEGWGIIGMLLLALIVGIIPFNLCKGFGMPAKKAFYLTYILFYIVTWVSYQQLFYGLSDHNLGLVNLGLLIVFFVAVFKMIPQKKSNRDIIQELKSPFESEIQKNINVGKREKKLETRTNRELSFESNTLQDIAEALAQILRIVESSQGNLSGEQRKRIAYFLQTLANKENLFNNKMAKIQGLLKQIRIMDEKQLDDLKSRAEKANEKERLFLNTTIQKEEEKLKINNAIKKIEETLLGLNQKFNQSIRSAVEDMNNPQYYNATKNSLSMARTILTQIFNLIEQMQYYENKVIGITKAEKELLKKEKQIA